MKFLLMTLFLLGALGCSSSEEEVVRTCAELAGKEMTEEERMRCPRTMNFKPSEPLEW